MDENPECFSIQPIHRRGNVANLEPRLSIWYRSSHNFFFNPKEAFNKVNCICNRLAECQGDLWNKLEEIAIKNHQYQFIEVTSHIGFRCIHLFNCIFDDLNSLSFAESVGTKARILKINYCAIKPYFVTGI